MRKFSTIGLAYRLCQLSILLLILFAVIFVGGIGYTLLDAGAFPQLVINELFDAGYGLGRIKWCATCIGDHYLHFEDLQLSMKLWLLLRATLFFALAFLIVLELKKVLLSIRDTATFYRANYRSFSAIGNYGFLISLLSAFNFYVQGDQSHFNLSIPFLELGFSLGSWVLADIFWEGKLLLDDNQSII
ncbi:MAG: hypothetical protein KTR30_25650 [Saprospiraceae bacterium]|nr:hypothetical protein [Saprospiraceae bacterium]